MRYYQITIGPVGGGGQSLYSSHYKGTMDPGALDIEIDAMTSSFAAPVGFSRVSIWGVPLSFVTQAKDFNGQQITVTAGMAKGLPLATAAFNAKQQGVVLSGTVFQALANWTGTEMRLDLIVSTDGGATQDLPANLAVSWAKGSKLGDNIKAALMTAFPKYTVKVSVSDSLVLTELEAAACQTIQQFNAFVNALSRTLIPTNYGGVNITLLGTVFTVQDGAAPGSAKAIAFQDIIGQPTWFGPGQIGWDCVMRADIQPGDIVTFPQTVTISSAAQLGQQPADQINFKGQFIIQTVRALGRYKSARGEDWITSFQGAFVGGGQQGDAAPDVEG